MWHFFFFNDTATTEIYTLSLHDALPISNPLPPITPKANSLPAPLAVGWRIPLRSEEHTSELQSHLNLVCRLLLEKKKQVKPPDREFSSQYHIALSPKLFYIHSPHSHVHQ